MNWKQEAIEKLTKYDAMVNAMKNIPLEIRRLEAAVKAFRSLSADAIITKNKGPADDKIINSLVKRSQLQAAYKNAVAWVRTTDRALSVLTAEEQEVLLKMYIKPQKGVIDRLCEDLGVEQSSIYRKRDQALYRFTTALYGIC